MVSATPEAADAQRLVGDIGGTHARFALVVGPHGKPQSTLTLATGGHADLASAVEAYLAQADHAVRPCEAAVAIAGPVDGDDAVRMTNAGWAFSIETTRRRLGLGRLVMLNDWEAVALAVPAFSDADVLRIGGGEPIESAPRALLGPGTGLGVSALVRSPRGEWLPIVGEGGHVTLAPADEREAAIVAVVRRRHAHVSAERLLSGFGLVNLYTAIAELDGVAAQPYEAADVTRHGLAADEAQCAQALATFCSLLGNVAGNLALTFGARGGVYVGGGIVPRLGEYFERSPFRQRFEAKGRFADYLARIPTYVVRADNPALTGAAMALGVKPLG